MRVLGNAVTELIYSSYFGTDFNGMSQNELLNILNVYRITWLLCCPNMIRPRQFLKPGNNFLIWLKFWARFLSLSQTCLRTVLDSNNLLSFLAETIWFSVAPRDLELS